MSKANAEYKRRDKVEKFTFKTSLNAFNEHCTNIVAVKQRIYLNKTKMDPEDYNLVLALLDNIYKIDKGTYDAINKQDARRNKIRQTRAGIKATLQPTHREKMGRSLSAQRR